MRNSERGIRNHVYSAIRNPNSFLSSAFIQGGNLELNSSGWCIKLQFSRGPEVALLCVRTAFRNRCVVTQCRLRSSSPTS